MKTIASRNTTTIALVRSGILGGFVATCVGSGGRRAASEKKRWRSYEFVNPVGSEMIIKRRLESGTSRGNAAARHNGLAQRRSVVIDQRATPAWCRRASGERDAVLSRNWTGSSHAASR